MCNIMIRTHEKFSLDPVTLNVVFCENKLCPGQMSVIIWWKPFELVVIQCSVMSDPGVTFGLDSVSSNINFCENRLQNRLRTQWAGSQELHLVIVFLALSENVATTLSRSGLYNLNVEKKKTWQGYFNEDLVVNIHHTCL